MIKEYTKHVMHNAIADLLLTNAQPVPEQQAPASFPLTLFP